MIKKFLHLLAKFLFIFLGGAKIIGQENVPKEGGVIIASNHKSNWDPPIVFAAMPRQVYFLAKEELFHNFFLRKFLNALEMVPLHRGKVDRTAMRKSFAIIRRGELLGIFPEGTRIRHEGLGPFHTGMASLALRLGVPIVPVAAIHTMHPWSKSVPVVAIGEPVMVEKSKPTPEKIIELNNLIKERIEKLYEMYKG